MVVADEKPNLGKIRIDLRHAIMMIARSLDYVGVDDCNHGHRVGYIAYECAKRLGWSDSRCEFIYLAGLIHDCGVSSIREHKRLLGDMRPPGAQDHCDTGHEYLSNCVVLRPFAPCILYHHTPWSKLKDAKIDVVDKEAAALISLADRVDFLRAHYTSEVHSDLVVMFEDQIADNIRERAGSLFKHDYVDAMIELVHIDGFWYRMDQGFIESIGFSMGNNGVYSFDLSISETMNLAHFIARIVDAKSPFTFEHSECVADLSRELGNDSGLRGIELDELQIAALLHDVGKLRVDEGLLEKNGKLTTEEFVHVKRHVVDTGLALEGFFPSSKIPQWAANHHERLDGTGYPFRLAGDELDLQSRIIGVADIFQALAQNRPYRGRLTIDQIHKIMKPLAIDGKIDPHIYRRIEDNPERYYAIAIGAETYHPLTNTEDENFEMV